MFGERILFEKFDKFTNSIENTRDLEAPTAPIVDFLKRILTQSKQISQIITYIWRWADEDSHKFPELVDTAKSLQQYFVKPTETNEGIPGIPGGGLEKLFRANPLRWLDSSDQEKENLSDKKEAKLLVTVFGEERIRSGIFPIFNEFELGTPDAPAGYLFEVNFNSFHGTIADPDKNTLGLLRFTIPYPPSPKFGESTVTLQELENWINNKDANKVAADNPYIPATSS
ncbi:MAG: hypothetical protein DSM106950_04490 [Stigonema ocellatum SAG 48.90 = DSM 106950]|nr:hypothetical protein [Stigonema ocellatum SAG 48.90 = DSM 106950]